MMAALTSCTKTKYADKFGFLPENDAVANSEAFQRCLDGGGRIKVRKAGEYKLCRTIYLDSDTDLEFADGAVLSRAEDDEGVAARFVLLNRGALTREYNDNICIKGLQLKANGIDAGKGRPVDIPTIVGMCCHTGFFYVRNLVLDGYTFLDLPPNDFAIQICTFENAIVENVHIEGMKDAVHFGPGRNFIVRHGFAVCGDKAAVRIRQRVGRVSLGQRGRHGTQCQCQDQDQHHQLFHVVIPP